MKNWRLDFDYLVEFHRAVVYSFASCFDVFPNFGIGLFLDRFLGILTLDS